MPPFSCLWPCWFGLSARLAERASRQKRSSELATRMPANMSDFFTHQAVDSHKSLILLLGTKFAYTLREPVRTELLNYLTKANPMKLIKKVGIAAVLATTLGAANAAFVINSSVGGAATGVLKWNLDGDAPAGISSSFSPGGALVIGSMGGQYAAPSLSGGNGTGFGIGGGDQADGVNTTQYGTSGSTGANPTAQFTLAFTGLQKYFGLLWGSVDDYNMLSFFNGAAAVGSVTGLQVALLPNGDQGPSGTRYVNINSDQAFDRVVFTSSQFAFEFDNVAWSDPGQDVPEPGSLALLGLGLAGLAAVSRRKQKQA